jgi:hypothetical protein
LWDTDLLAGHGGGQPAQGQKQKLAAEGKDVVNPASSCASLTARRPLCPGRASKSVRVAGWWDPAEKRYPRSTTTSLGPVPFSSERYTVTYRYRLTRPFQQLNRTSHTGKRMQVSTLLLYLATHGVGMLHQSVDRNVCLCHNQQVISKY